jgi:ABC-type lipoprotein release transport system permease subunit
VALLAANRLGPLLFETSPRDPLVLVGASAALLLVACLAGLIPALAAARVDPMGALKTE